MLTVPGAVDGWREAHERFGRLAWSELFGAAIHYARDGTPVSRSLADWLVADLPILREYPETARIFLPEGEPQREGARLVQADLARSLEELASAGARAFYEGDIARRICAGLGPQGSPLVPEDFAAYRAGWVEPISTTYRGFEVVEMPPNTQGFAALQILNLLQRDIYATAAIAGITVYLLLQWLGMPPPIPAGVGMVTVVGLRLLAIIRGMHLPVIRTRRERT